MDPTLFADYMGAAPIPTDVATDIHRFWQPASVDPEGASWWSRALSSVVRGASPPRPVPFGNPHSAHAAGNRSRESIEAVRRSVLTTFGAAGQYDCIFTGGCTAAIKLVGDAFFGSPNDRSRMLVVHWASHNSVLGLRSMSMRAAGAIGHGGSDPDAPEADRRFGCIPMQPRGDDAVSAREAATACARSLAPGSRGSILVALPAECNFSGTRFPVRSMAAAFRSTFQQEASKIHAHWTVYVLVDAAAAAPTVPLMLDDTRGDGGHIDFVCLSFYKMFGAPTGVGALLVRGVRNSDTPCGAEFLLRHKAYFGGGTVAAVTFNGEDGYVRRRRDTAASSTVITCHEGLEDGTPNFLSVPLLRFGLAWWGRTMRDEAKQRSLFDLQASLCRRLKALRHPSTGLPLVSALHRVGMIVDSREECAAYAFGPKRPGDTVPPWWRQGNVVTVSLQDAQGRPIGHAAVEKLAVSSGVSLRAGCFCNPGACEHYLQRTPSEVRRHHEEGGHNCWDDHDIFEGRPTGAVRLSLGHASTAATVDALTAFFERTFLSGTLPVPSSAKPPARAGTRVQVVRTTVFPVKGCFGVVIASTLPGEVSGLVTELRHGTGDDPRSRTPAPGSAVVAFPDRRRGVVHWTVSATGLWLDREWMLVDGNYQPWTPKRSAALSYLEVAIDLERSVLRFAYDDHHLDVALHDDDDEGESPIADRPHHPSHVVELGAADCGQPNGAAAVRRVPTSARIRGRNINAALGYSDAVDAWLSDAFRYAMQRHDGRQEPVEVHLLRRFGESATFSNNEPVLVATLASHSDVVEHMHAADPEASLSVDVYRANLVLGATATSSKEPFVDVTFQPGYDAAVGAPWFERRIDRLHFSGTGVALQSAGPCYRCEQLGIRRWGVRSPEPLGAISRMRANEPLSRADAREPTKVGGVEFGQLFTVVITCAPPGDEVTGIPERQATDDSKARFILPVALGAVATVAATYLLLSSRRRRQ